MNIPNGSIYYTYIDVGDSPLLFAGKGQYGRWNASRCTREQDKIEWVAVAPVLTARPNFTDMDNGPMEFGVSAVITIRKSEPVGYKSTDEDTLRLLDGAIDKWKVSTDVLTILDDVNDCDTPDQYRYRKDELRRPTEMLIMEVNSHVSEVARDRFEKVELTEVKVEDEEDIVR